MASRGRWIGVDFDETLRRYDDSPIAPMVDRVKRWLADGLDVRIVTARMYEPQHHEFDFPQDFTDACVENSRWRTANGGPTIEHQRELVQRWCEKHVGRRLPVRYGKGPGMIELWDDKAVAVEPNTGRRVSPCSTEGPLTSSDHVYEVLELARDVKPGCGCGDLGDACPRCDAARAVQLAIKAMDADLQVVSRRDDEPAEMEKSVVQSTTPERMLELRKAITCRMKWINADHAAEILKKHDELATTVKMYEQTNAALRGFEALVESVAARNVERVMNDASGFHVDGLDAKARTDFLTLIVRAAWGGKS